MKRRLRLVASVITLAGIGWWWLAGGPTSVVRGWAPVPPPPAKQNPEGPSAVPPRGFVARVAQTLHLDRQVDEAVEEVEDRDRGVDEAQNWELMSDEERVAAGLTTEILFANQHAGVLGGVAFGLSLHMDKPGVEKIHAELVALSTELADVEKTPHDRDRIKPLLEREAHLLAELRKLPEAAPLGLDEAQKSLDAMLDGDGPSVDRKISNERGEALARHGQDLIGAAGGSAPAPPTNTQTKNGEQW